MDPRAKVIWYCLIVTLEFLFTDYRYNLVFAALGVLPIVALSRISVAKMLRMIAPFSTFFVGLMLLWPFFRPEGVTLFVLFGFKAGLDGLKIGLAVAIRVFAILVMSVTLAMTTRPLDFVQAGVLLGWPFRYAYAIIALPVRMLPVFYGFMYDVMTAQRLRGVNVESALGRLGAFFALVVPVIRKSITMSYSMAAAAETRAFGASNEHVFAETLSFGRSDLGLVIVSFALFLLGILSLFHLGPL